MSWFTKVVRLIGHASDPEQQTGLVSELIDAASKAAGIRIFSLFLCQTDDVLRANNARGFADLGQDMQLSAFERRAALDRATQQTLPPMIVKSCMPLPLRWAVLGANGEEVDDPVGVRSRITCDVLLVHGSAAATQLIEDFCADRSWHVEGVIAAPIAYYRGLQGHLPKAAVWW